MPAAPKTLQPTVASRGLFVAVYVAGLAMLRLHLPFGIPERHRIWIFPLYALGGALAVALMFTTRIVLEDDCLRIVAGFRSRTIPHAEIEGVTWEKGCGTYLRLRSGESITLPNVGHSAPGLANTIRAWLKR